MSSKVGPQCDTCWNLHKEKGSKSAKKYVKRWTYLPLVHFLPNKACCGRHSAIAINSGEKRNKYGKYVPQTSCARLFSYGIYFNTMSKVIRTAISSTYTNKHIMIALQQLVFPCETSWTQDLYNGYN